MKLDPYITLCTKINSKDLKVRPKTVKVLEENIVKKLLDISLGNYIFDITLKAQAANAKIGTWDCIKLKRFCTTKETRQPTE